MRWIVAILLLLSCNASRKMPVASWQLDASKSYDADGYIVEWRWRVISGSGILSNSKSVLTKLSNGATIELTVTDNLGAVGKDTVVVK